MTRCLEEGDCMLQKFLWSTTVGGRGRWRDRGLPEIEDRHYNSGQEEVLQIYGDVSLLHQEELF